MRLRDAVLSSPTGKAPARNPLPLPTPRRAIGSRPLSRCRRSRPPQARSLPRCSTFAGSSGGSRRSGTTAPPALAAASASSVTATGRPTTTRGFGRPAPSAALLMRGTMCVSRVFGPTIQVIVPSVISPAMRSITGASAAMSTGGGAGTGTETAALTRKNSPLKLTRPSRIRGKEHRKILPHVDRGPLVRQPPHPFHNRRVRQADAEVEPPAARRLGRQRLLRHDVRVSRIRRYDGCSHLDAACLLPGQREDGEDVGAEDLPEPDAVESIVFSVYDALDLAVDIAVRRPRIALVSWLLLRNQQNRRSVPPASSIWAIKVCYDSVTSILLTNFRFGGSMASATTPEPPWSRNSRTRAHPCRRTCRAVFAAAGPQDFRPRFAVEDLPSMPR